MAFVVRFLRMCPHARMVAFRSDCGWYVCVQLLHSHQCSSCICYVLAIGCRVAFRDPSLGEFASVCFHDMFRAYRRIFAGVRVTIVSVVFVEFYSGL